MNDRERFLTLWESFMEEASVQGAAGIPSIRTMAFYRRVLFDYVQGISKGIALIDDEHDAVLLAGEPLGGTSYDTKFDPYAYGWGAYVSPEHRRRGISRAIHAAAETLLREIGSKQYLATVSVENHASQKMLARMGWQVIERQYRKEL